MTKTMHEIGTEYSSVYDLLLYNTQQTDHYLYYKTRFLQCRSPMLWPIDHATSLVTHVSKLDNQLSGAESIQKLVKIHNINVL